MKECFKSKRGQVTIFIILAILIVGGAVAYFFLKDYLVASSVPENMKPVYDYYLSCVQEHTEQGITLLGEQGGYIEVPEFIPGSSYMPFSSQLDFLGQPVPYWMYVSGNNFLKEQKPTKSMMEQQLKEYVEERIDDCDFSDYNLQGFDVVIDKGNADVKINEKNVDVSLDNSVKIYFEGESAIVNNHKFSISSKLGKFYDLASKVFDYEKKNMFLEAYALDVMRLYAPVDGVELTCSPKVFIDEQIRGNISEGLAANIGALKLKGDYYNLNNKENEYFVTDIGTNIDENINMIYSPDWTTRIEIYGDRVAKPVGLQEGLNVMGFCYVPYHLVYDINFPVMIQFYDNEEVFQFPMAVIISKNQARNATSGESNSLESDEVCKYKNQNVQVYTYDSQLEPVEARIQFKCLNSLCEIGETKFDSQGDAVLDEEMPQCVNGFIIASADGYADSKYQISTNKEDFANVVLNKKYKIPLDLGNVDSALISFNSEDYSTSVFYPDMKEAELIEGMYNVSVYSYRNSSLTLPASNNRKCVMVPKEGVLGVFGQEEERCFDINLPAMNIDSALVGGGKASEYITEGQLRDSSELNINVPIFGTPQSLDDLQQNYIDVEDSTVYLTYE